MFMQNLKQSKTVKQLAEEIYQIALKIDEAYIMEVCGTHTMSIAKNGIKSLLPKNIHLISGPGCPVCVTPTRVIDMFIQAAHMPKTIIATFGDMMRVPGSKTNLYNVASKTAVRIVYSSLDALNLAKTHKDKNVIFLGIGFETTTPTTAATIIKAKSMNLKNFYVLSAHKNMPNVMNLIAKQPDLKIDGFLLPGHVCSITGLNPFNFLSKEYGLSGVVAGFEPAEILLAIKQLLSQIAENKPQILNKYNYAVKQEGNIHAQNLINKVFIHCDTTWRGLGKIKNSGYAINDEYSDTDAEKVFDLKVKNVSEKTNCKCGEILQGKLTPAQCPMFKKICTPQNPIGPCMVSTEGSCAAHYKYNL